MNIPKQVIENFNLVSNEYSIHQHGNGLIHQTYVVVKKDSPIFILQKVNHHVFKKPEDIAFNTAFSRRRIYVEHAIGRARCFEAITQMDRHHRRSHTARVVAVCGLVNRRLAHTLALRFPTLKLC